MRESESVQDRPAYLVTAVRESWQLPEPFQKKQEELEWAEHQEEERGRRDNCPVCQGRGVYQINGSAVALCAEPAATELAVCECDVCSSKDASLRHFFASSGDWWLLLLCAVVPVTAVIPHGRQIDFPVWIEGVARYANAGIPFRHHFKAAPPEALGSPGYGAPRPKPSARNEKRANRKGRALFLCKAIQDLPLDANATVAQDAASPDSRGP